MLQYHIYFLHTDIRAYVEYLAYGLYSEDILLVLEICRFPHMNHFFSFAQGHPFYICQHKSLYNDLQECRIKVTPPRFYKVFYSQSS